MPHDPRHQTDDEQDSLSTHHRIDRTDIGNVAGQSRRNGKGLVLKCVRTEPGEPDYSILRDAIAILRELDREEEIDLVWFGGVRSGTDAAKLFGMGVVAVVQGVAMGIAAGGEIRGGTLAFSSNDDDEDRTAGVVNLIRANSGEASMMARCTGKTVLHNLEPEDLRAISLVTSEDTGMPLVGTTKHAAQQV